MTGAKTRTTIDYHVREEEIRQFGGDVVRPFADARVEVEYQPGGGRRALLILETMVDQVRRDVEANP